MQSHVQLSNKNVIWVWLDLEITDFYFKIKDIFEIAPIPTNTRLERLETFYQIVQIEYILAFTQHINKEFLKFIQKKNENISYT